MSSFPPVSECPAAANQKTPDRGGSFSGRAPDCRPSAAPAAQEDVMKAALIRILARLRRVIGDCPGGDGLTRCAQIGNRFRQ